MTERATLEIARLGAQGDGIADTPAGPVFIGRCLPGERIVAEVRGDRGRLLEIEQREPRPGRAALPALRRVRRLRRPAHG